MVKFRDELGDVLSSKSALFQWMFKSFNPRWHARMKRSRTELLNKELFRNVPNAVSRDRETIYFLGINRSTVVGALIARKRFKGNIFFVLEQATSLQQTVSALNFDTIMLDELPTSAEIWYAEGANPIPTLRSKHFLLDYRFNNTVTTLLRDHSAIELHRIGSMLENIGWSKEATYIHHCIYYLFNCRVPNSVHIGDGATLAYGGIGVVINKNSRIGKNVKISQNVTLGAKPGGYGPPVIGDGVFIGPNSVLLGGQVGENSIIGAGSVVLKPVPANSVVAGNPARLIKTLEAN